jgi:acyl-coenzyme A thioesterase PaaI-like protein
VNTWIQVCRRFALFNIEALDVGDDHGTLQLDSGPNATRPGGIISGPVPFALANIAIYALILVARRDPEAVTADMINFLRPAKLLLLATAAPLRSGCRLFTGEVRIAEAASTRLVSQATGTYAWSAGP